MALKLAVFQIKDFYHKDKRYAYVRSSRPYAEACLFLWGLQWTVPYEGGGCLGVARRLFRVCETRQNYSEADHGSRKCYQLVNKAMAHVVCLFLQVEVWYTAEKGMAWHLT